MKQSTINFIKEMFYNELDGEYYDDFFDQEELDDYTKDLVNAARDFFRNNTDWFANYALEEKLEEIGADGV
jgi:hypothetical protein